MFFFPWFVFSFWVILKLHFSEQCLFRIHYIQNNSLLRRTKAGILANLRTIFMILSSQSSLQEIKNNNFFKCSWKQKVSLKWLRTLKLSRSERKK